MIVACPIDAPWILHTEFRSVYTLWTDLTTQEVKSDYSCKNVSEEISALHCAFFGGARPSPQLDHSLEVRLRIELLPYFTSHTLS